MLRITCRVGRIKARVADRDRVPLALQQFRDIQSIFYSSRDNLTRPIPPHPLTHTDGKTEKHGKYQCCLIPAMATHTPIPTRFVKSAHEVVVFYMYLHLYMCKYM